MTLYAILRTFFSENVVALRRRVISSIRGCRHVPGLSATGAALTGVLTGVDMIWEGCVVVKGISLKDAPSLMVNSLVNARHLVKLEVYRRELLQ